MAQARLDHVEGSHRQALGLLRDRLQRCDTLRDVEAPLETFSTEATDTVLHLCELTRPVLSEAYGIAKVQARTNKTIKSLANRRHNDSCCAHNLTRACFADI